MRQHVVVEDPSGEYWDGALVSDEAGKVLRARGVTTLEVEADFIRRSPVGGWSKRSWGSGWSLNAAVPRFACPLMLFIGRDDGPSKLHWAARLVADEGGFPDDLAQRTGSLRLAGDSGQPGCTSGGVDMGTVILAREIGRPDARGSWVLTGSNDLRPAALDAFLGVALYGSLPGLRVAWAAVSQVR